MPEWDRDMNSIKSCPTCGYACSAVRNTDGDVLGYFCNLVVDGACDYIDVKSSIEYEVENKHGSEKES